MKTGLQLRCQIRTCEARIEHLTAAISSGDFPAPYGCKARLEQAHADLAIFRAEQSALFGHPPAGSNLATAASSRGSVQPATASAHS